MLIAEQLILLLLDPERGELEVRSDATDPDRLATAALLLDLAEQRNLSHRNGHVAFNQRFPSGHLLLTVAADSLAGAGPGLPLASALDLIETRTRPTSRTLLKACIGAMFFIATVGRSGGRWRRGNIRCAHRRRATKRWRCYAVARNAHLCASRVCCC